MKNSFRILLSVIFIFLFVTAHSQKKKVSTKTKNIGQIAQRSFGHPTSISEITDIQVSDAAYESLKNLIENYEVTTTYSDNSFRGKELLKRGDFIVALNSALNNLKNKMDKAGLDTSIFNTYDRNRGGAYLTEITQIKDITENSIYYPAAKSLIERWGIAAPFAINKTLNANSSITEKEVYDILRVAMGYISSGVNPYSTAISRNKFIIVLNNCLTQKMTEISSLNRIQQLKMEAERKSQLDSLQLIDIARKDSISKEIELRKQEAVKKEEEARKKLAEKKKK